MARQLVVVCILFTLITGLAFAQGLETTATKDDWEEINFEFNSYVLSDGYPSLLRIAELLSQNTGYRVRVQGHTDWVGSVPYNNTLGQNRANTVRDFLLKYGARADQVTTTTSGEQLPKVDNASKEGRFMNRRVVLQVTDQNGNVVGAGGAGNAIQALEAAQKMQEDCCNQILSRLDKLDEILAAIKQLQADNAGLRADLDALRNRPQPTAPPPAPPTIPESRVTEIAREAAQQTIQQTSMPKFSILGLNAGVDDTKNLTFTGRGRFFNPFNEHVAFQAQGEYLYFKDRKEAQIDFGIVNRWANVQMGGFASFKNVALREMQETGTLGQASFTLDYLFGAGRVGIFGTKGFLNDSIVSRTAMTSSFNVWQEQYLHIVEQAGGSAAFNLGPRVWFEGNLGYLRSAVGNSAPGGTGRFVFPLNNRFAFTVEGGVNETLLSSDTNGRVTFGFLFGNFMQPREYRAANHPVPVDIPRVRYEVLTRLTRTGNDPPIADAGPDQIGVAAGTITLDGSASYDPDGDPITYQWTPIAPTSVSLSSPTTATTTFTAEPGRTYNFRLTVTDPEGARGIARVTVSTRETPRVQIVRFVASPALINAGETASLNYAVQNADSVTISGVTQSLSPTNGTVQVSPTQTTTYTLTARNSVSEDTAIATVVVNRPQPQFLSCAATPVTIIEGEASSLSWNTTGATSVEIPGVGNFGPTGSTIVTPTTTTTYTLVAKNQFGQSTCTTTVAVQAGPVPTIVSFNATPTSIIEGNGSTLVWRVEGADTVTIDNGIGTVPASGSREVSPTTTTTYTLTATNSSGSSTASVTLTVIPRARVISFTATPSTIRPGELVTFTWRTENATEVYIGEDLAARDPNGSLTTSVRSTTTTYTLTAIGNGSVDTASVTVTVQAGSAGNRPPTPIISGGVDLTTTTKTFTLSAASSFDPEGDPFTYQWAAVQGTATIASPGSATTSVTLGTTTYDYWVFELTTTDSKGAASKQIVRVTFVDPDFDPDEDLPTPAPF